MGHKALVAFSAALVLAAGIAHVSSSDVRSDGSYRAEKSASYIVQGRSAASVARIVRSVGGEITHELEVIRAVGATLTNKEATVLKNHPDVRRLYGNAAVEVAAKGGKSNSGGGSISNSTVLETHYPSLVNADAVHAKGIDGSGVGIAVLDTGLWKTGGIKLDPAGATRLKAVYNAITDTALNNVNQGVDPAGHGTHVASIAVSSLSTDSNKYNGVAPGAHLVSVQAFDENGNGTYADVIRAIEWVVKNKSKHKIKVLNLSFSAEPRSHYWDDPINQAVMVAWQHEILVVAAAGNRGPDPMTIGVPGNVPYIVTVGAMTDNFTPEDGSDDVLASFSSAGPTVEGFVKPELVAPGGHIAGLMDANSALAQEFPEFYVGGRYFEMSGTSQSTAVVSGIAALVLQAEPWRSVDEVKCKLMASARPAVGADNSLAYSVFQQGAGLADAYAAVHSQEIDCANNGLHIDNDIDGERHYGGRANQDSDGNYYLMGLDGYMWTNGYLWTEGYMWTNGYLWTERYMWTDSYLWTDGDVGADGYMWTDGDMWTNGYLWTNGYMWTKGHMWTNTLTEMATMSGWVDQE